ncbi:MAG: LptF/LptG family permease, partial [Thermodesulfobacteriota bacterium]|nr:LptF/LptG family permease [Thermodesulfobacteriota bacterium]
MFRKTFFFWIASLVSLTLLFMVSRLFGDISMFVEHNTDMPTIVKYMMFCYPKMVYLILPFSVCLGILAAQASFSRHTETIAMQACSVSVYRIYLPFIALGILATFIMTLISFYIYPVSQRHADRIEDIFIKKRDVKGAFTVSGGRFKIGNRFYYIEHMDIKKGIMQNITCYEVTKGRLASVIEAKSAVWNNVPKERWSAEGMKTSYLKEGGIELNSQGKVLPLTKPPQDLVMASPRPDVLTLKELRQYIRHLRSDGIRSVSIETYYHSLISFAMTPIIMTLLVVPFGMRFPRTGGIARGIASGLILGLVYWGGHSAMINLGASGFFPPAIAAWATNIAAIFLGGL